MKKITTEEFDARFDRGEDIMGFMDISTLKRPNQALGTEQAYTGKTRELKQGYEEHHEHRGIQSCETAREIVTSVQMKSGLNDDGAMTIAVKETRKLRQEQ